jgi:hypothetical protein
MALYVVVNYEVEGLAPGTKPTIVSYSATQHIPTICRAFFRISIIFAEFSNALTYFKAAIV